MATAGVALKAVGLVGGIDPAAGAGRGLALCGAVVHAVLLGAVLRARRARKRGDSRPAGASRRIPSGRKGQSWPPKVGRAHCDAPLGPGIDAAGEPLPR